MSKSDALIKVLLDRKAAEKERSGLIGLRKFKQMLTGAHPNNPIVASIDEFFDGNDDQSSICPNCGLSLEQIRKIIDGLILNQLVRKVFIGVTDLDMRAQDWPSSNVVYFYGDIDITKLRAAIASLKPAELQEGYAGLKPIGLPKSFDDEQVITALWD